MSINFLTVSRAWLLLAALSLLTSEVAMATEEPVFEVLEKTGSIEIRQYRPMIVAETVVEGDMDAATNGGFRLIADYIFGNNQSSPGSGESIPEKIAMTAPVTVAPVARSEKIAMTAPVTVEPQNDVGDRPMQATRWRVHFVMPSEYSLARLPKPRNTAVVLREVPGKRYAALVFSGLVSDEKAQQKTDELLAWLATRSLRPAAAPQLARYNPPWTLPFLRRNEILVELPPS